MGLPDEQLARELLADEGFRAPPMSHQAVGVVWAASLERPRAALWFDIGTGKTLTALFANQFWGFHRLLIVCPNCVVETWAEEIRDKTPWKAVTLTGPGEERRRLLFSGKSGLYVVNYEGLKVLFTKRRKNKWTINPKELKATVAEARLDSVVFDESQCLSSPRTLQTRIAAELARQADKVLLLTGTPTSRGEDDIWSQFRVMDASWTAKHLGRTLDGFRNRWMEPAQWAWITTRRGQRRKIPTRWQVKPNLRDQLYDILGQRALRYSREECFDLPERSYTTRYCYLTAEQDEAIEELINRYDEDEAMLLATKLAQVPGGTLIEDHEARHFVPNPKLDLLMEVLREIGDRKAVVYHSYVEEGRLIEARLQQEGIGFASLRGEVPPAEREAGLRRLREDPQCRVLVAHPKSGGVGINLQHINVSIFYSNGTSGAAVRAQAEGRTWRAGQKSKCLYIDLVAVGSLDELRLERLRDQTEVMQKALEYVRERRKSL